MDVLICIHDCWLIYVHACAASVLLGQL